MSGLNGEHYTHHQNMRKKFEFTTNDDVSNLLDLVVHFLKFLLLFHDFVKSRDNLVHR